MRRRCKRRCAASDSPARIRNSIRGAASCGCERANLKRRIFSCSGGTGFPLVDAGVRELRATGRMHPRVRAIVASFLCFDLGVDWRVGRDDWDRLLIEDDPALATGNWQWVAGVGADLAAYPRIYNPVKQAHRFDPAANYVRKWIPELAALPDASIFERTDRQPQLALALFGAREYPRPILDHEEAARAFLTRYRAEVEPATPVSP